MPKSDKRKVSKKILLLKTEAEYIIKLNEAKLKDMQTFLPIPIHSIPLMIQYEMKLAAIKQTPSSHFKADGSGKLDKRRIKRSLVGAVNNNKCVLINTIDKQV